MLETVNHGSREPRVTCSLVVGATLEQSSADRNTSFKPGALREGCCILADAPVPPPPPPPPLLLVSPSPWYIGTGPLLNALVLTVLSFRKEKAGFSTAHVPPTDSLRFELLPGLKLSLLHVRPSFALPPAPSSWYSSRGPLSTHEHECRGSCLCSR